MANRTVPAAALVAALAVAGCTGSSAGPLSGGTSTPQASGGSTASSPYTAPVSGSLPSGVTQGPLPSTVANKVAKRKAVAITTCRKTNDGWQAAGTATNTGTAKASYRITIFFTTTTATVLSYARTTAEVNKGKTKKWTASAKFRSPAVMDCVLRGVG